MKIFCFAIVFVLSLSAFAADSVINNVGSSFGTVSCSATLATDTSKDIASATTIIINKPHFNVLCNDGSSDTLYIATDDSNATVICDHLKYHGGYVTTPTRAPVNSIYRVTQGPDKQLVLTLKRGFAAAGSMVCEK